MSRAVIHVITLALATGSEPCTAGAPWCCTHFTQSVLSPSGLTMRAHLHPGGGGPHEEVSSGLLCGSFQDKSPSSPAAAQVHPHLMPRPIPAPESCLSGRRVWNSPQSWGGEYQGWSMRCEGEGAGGDFPFFVTLHSFSPLPQLLH